MDKTPTNKNHQAIQLAQSKLIIAPLASFVLSILLFFLHPLAGIFGLVLTVLSYLVASRMEEDSRQRARLAVESMDKNFDEITKNAIFRMPFPMAVLNEEGSFLWYNSLFKEVFQIQTSLLGQSYRKAMGEISLEGLGESKEPISLTVGSSHYSFYHNITSEDREDCLYLLYGVDDSHEKIMEARYEDNKLVIFSIFFDNYDEVRSKTSEQDRPLLTAQVDRLMNAYAGELEAVCIKYENDRYILITNQAMLDKAKRENFHILDDIKTIEGTGITPTLSLGIAYGELTPQEIWTESRQAMDIALSRGGDQAVLKSGDQLDYYGGKNQATQRFTKVKARVMSNTIRSFILNSDWTFIMGHENPDMDSLGACLGMATFTKSIGGNPLIVLGEVSAAVENLYAKVMEELPDADNLIISPEEAMERRTESSLIIVVDNHRHDSTAAPALLDKGNRIIIIDHHRRGADYIHEAEISYIEPYASSASEMVTELISYLDTSPKLPRVVAEGLLAGITVDTKDFYYQTGTRTFEAAAYLKRQGADSIVIKQLFQDDFTLTQYRSEILANAIQFENHTMIGRFERKMEGTTLVASQAADELMGIRGVEASFVLCYAGDKVHISARSFGDVSVQLIMEALGGGGHLTAAATQLKVTMDEAEEKLKEAIHNYFKEEDNESHFA